MYIVVAAHACIFGLGSGVMMFEVFLALIFGLIFVGWVFHYLAGVAISGT